MPERRGWRIWRGVSGLWYARKLKTSPPRVLRQPTREDLLAELDEREAQQNRWDQ